MRTSMALDKNREPKTLRVRVSDDGIVPVYNEEKG